MLVVFCVIGPITAQEEVKKYEVKIGGGTLTFNGKISTGIEATFDDDANTKGKVRMYNDGDSGNEFRGELGTLYENGNVGFNLRFRATNGQLNQGSPIGLRWAFGWINLFDGHFRPVGGFVENNVWGTKGDLDGDVNGAGLRLEFKPIAGLNFGAFLRVPGQAGAGWGVGGSLVPPTSSTTGMVQTDEGTYITLAPVAATTHNIEQFLKATALGLAYDHSAFYLRLQYLIDADANDTGTAEAANGGRLDFGLGFTGLPALEAHVEGRISQLDDFSSANNKGAADFRQTVGYTISEALPLTIKLNVKEVLFGNDALDPWLGFNPSVSYAVSKALTVGLAGGYGFGYAVPAGSTASITGLRKVESEIYVKPNLSYNFGNGLTTKLWYKFNVLKAAAATDPVNSSTIQLDFVWSF